jgi:hypothetical protein
VFFIGNATSNFTVDLTSFWASANELANGNSDNNRTKDMDFPIGTFTCKVFILNPSTNTQLIQSTSFLHLNIETPEGSNSKVNLGYGDALFDKAGNAIKYNIYAAGGAADTKFSKFTNGAGNTMAAAAAIPAGGYLSLDPVSGAAMAEITVPLIFKVKYTNGWIDISKDIHPFAKLHHTCTGMLEITDADSTKPGFVIASGTMDYLSSSYQQPPLSTGGIVTRYLNSMNVTREVDAGGFAAADMTNMVSDCPVWAPVCPSTPLIPACNDPGAPATNNGGDWTWYKVFAQSGLHTSIGANAEVSFAIDNNQTRSSFQPAHMQNMAIVVNGGNPI